jgi:hypothetical protein
MNSTNEVGIGFHRVDGTAKPELEPFLRIAKFMAQHGQYLKDRVSEPVGDGDSTLADVCATQLCAGSNAQSCARDVLPLRRSGAGISEYTLSEYAGQAKLIIVPSPRVLTLKCYEMLKAEAERGAVIAISGPITKNAYGIPTGPRPDYLFYTRVRPVAPSEYITFNGREYLVRYEGEKLQRLEKAWLAPPENPPVSPHIGVSGAGKFVWSPLPLELGDSMPALVEFYRMALSQAGISPVFRAVPSTPAVLILPSVFRDVVLYMFVSEIGRTRACRSRTSSREQDSM